MCSVCVPAGSLKRVSWADDLLPGKSRRPLDPSSGGLGILLRWRCGCVGEYTYVEVGMDRNGFGLIDIFVIV